MSSTSQEKSNKVPIHYATNSGYLAIWLTHCNLSQHICTFCQPEKWTKQFQKEIETLGEVLLTRLRLNFIHLNEHKFRHNFNDTTNPMCSCGAATERTIHYLLRCRLYSVQRVELLNIVCKVDSTLENSSED